MDDLVYLIRQFVDILEGFFRGQIPHWSNDGVLVKRAIGFSVAGLKFGIALGLFFGVLNIIPYLGTILGSSIRIYGILSANRWSLG